MKHSAFIIGLLSVILFCPDLVEAGQIHSKLATILQSAGQDEFLPVYIQMKDHPDQNTIKQVVSGLHRKEKPAAVWDYLEDLSDSTQTNILAYLRNTSSVQNIRVIRVLNGIAAEMKPPSVQAISQRSDIEIIYDDTVIECSLDKSNMSDTQLDNEMQLSELDDLSEAVALVNAALAWELGFTGNGVVIAVIDGGIWKNHNDIENHFWDGSGKFYDPDGAGGNEPVELLHHGWDFNNNNNFPIPNGPHGTQVTSLIVGDGTSGTQTGVAPGAKVMDLKATSDDDRMANITTVFEALGFALNLGVDIINMSVGFPVRGGISDDTSETGEPLDEPDPWQIENFRIIFDRLNDADIITCKSAGNYGEDQDICEVPYNISVPGAVPSPWRHRMR